MKSVEICFCSGCGSNGDSYVHMAIRLGHNVEIIKTLLEHDKAMAEAVNDEGQLPLHLAVKRQSEDIVDLLLQTYPLGAEKMDFQGRVPAVLCFEPHPLFNFSNVHPSLWVTVKDSLLYLNVESDGKPIVVKKDSRVRGYEEVSWERVGNKNRLLRVIAANGLRGWMPIEDEQGTYLEVISL